MQLTHGQQLVKHRVTPSVNVYRSIRKQWSKECKFNSNHLWNEVLANS